MTDVNEFFFELLIRWSSKKFQMYHCSLFHSKGVSYYSPKEIFDEQITKRQTKNPTQALTHILRARTRILWVGKASNKNVGISFPSLACSCSWPGRFNSPSRGRHTLKEGSFPVFGTKSVTCICGISCKSFPLKVQSFVENRVSGCIFLDKN